LFGSNCFSQDDNIKKGKALFNTNCAACHKINKRAVGPALKGVSDKYEKEWLYTWIKNSTAMVKSGDARAVAIYEEYNGSVMTSFPQLSNEDIDNILAYTDYIPPAPVAAIQTPVVATQNNSNISNTIILSVLVLVLLSLLTMLILVNKTLKKNCN
jgi:cytochrome c2